MGNIQSRKAAIGFRAAGQRPCCRNCCQGAEVPNEHAPSGVNSSWECKRYGFMVSAMAISDRHEPKGQTGGAS